jgi:hypothetical protein
LYLEKERRKWKKSIEGEVAEKEERRRKEEEEEKDILGPGQREEEVKEEY